MKDKLKVGPQIVEGTFETNRLRGTPGSSVFSFKTISHTDIVSLKDSHFQGYASNVMSVKHAVETTDALFHVLSPACYDKMGQLYV